MEKNKPLFEQIVAEHRAINDAKAAPVKMEPIVEVVTHGEPVALRPSGQQESRQLTEAANTHRANTAAALKSATARSMMAQALPKAPVLAQLGAAFNSHYEHAASFVWSNFASSNPTQDTGNGLLAAAIATRGSDYGPTKWFEVYTSPATHDWTFDVRRYPDYAANLFLADYLDKKISSLSMAAKPAQYTPAEINAALRSLRAADFKNVPMLAGYSSSKAKIVRSSETMVHTLDRLLDRLAKHWSTDYYSLADIIS